MNRNSRRQYAVVLGVVLAIWLAVFFFILILVSQPTGGDRHSLIRSELHNLEIAVAAFHLRHGHLPPSDKGLDIRKHLISHDGSVRLDAEQIEKLADLDASERLVFWLGGECRDPDILVERVSVFDFDPNKLVDADQDGFLEYTNGVDGHVYEFAPDMRTIVCECEGKLLSSPRLEVHN